MTQVQPASRPSPAAQPSEEEPEPAPPEPGGQQAGAGDQVLHQQEDPAGQAHQADGLQAEFSTLIGRGPKVLGSHWSRASECC